MSHHWARGREGTRAKFDWTIMMPGPYSNFYFSFQILRNLPKIMILTNLSKVSVSKQVFLLRTLLIHDGIFIPIFRMICCKGRLCWVFCFAFVLIFAFNHSSVINLSMVPYCFSIHKFIYDFLCTAGISSVAFHPHPHHLTIKFCSTSFTSLPLTILGITSKIGKERAWRGVRKFWTRRSNRRLFFPNKSSWVIVETELKDVMKFFKGSDSIWWYYIRRDLEQ